LPNPGIKVQKPANRKLTKQSTNELGFTAQTGWLGKLICIATGACGIVCQNARHSLSSLTI